MCVSLVPGGRLAPDQRLNSPALQDGRHRVEATVVTQPAVIYLAVLPTDDPLDAAVPGVHLDVAADRAAGANGRRTFQVPGPSLESVLATGQRADGTQLDGVAAKGRVERLARQHSDLAVPTAVEHRERFVAGDLGLESGAPIAQNAPLAIQHD